MHRRRLSRVSLFFESMLARVSQRETQRPSLGELDMSALESRMLFSASPLGALADPTDSDPTGGDDAWLIVEDYDDGVADLHTPQSGSWSVQDGRYRVSPVGNAISTFALAGPLDDSLEFNVTFNAEPNGFTNGFIIFDYQSQDDFKFAGAYVGSNQWVVGHYDAQGWTTEAFTSSSINTSTDYQLSLTITDGTNVELVADGQVQVSHTFSDSVTDGALGLGTRLATTSFDDLAVRSLIVANDPPPPPPPPEPTSNIDASQTGKDLLVTGDATGQLEILALSENSLQILDNGQELYSFENVTGNLKLEFGDGDDQVTLNLDGYAFQAKVTVDLGGGDDSFSVIDGSLDRSLKIHGGEGNDDISIENTVIAGWHTRILGESGEDTIHVHGEIGRNLYIQAGADDDVVTIDAAVGRHLKVKGDDGNDSITLTSDASVERHARIAGGLGDDDITIEGDIQKSLFVNAGAGNDDVSVDAVIGGHLKIRGSHGDDTITVSSDSVVAGYTCIHGGAGNDTIDLQGEFQRSLHIKAGSGDDDVSVNASIAHFLSVRGGRGDDNIAIADGNHVGWCAIVKGGSGNDSIDVQGNIQKGLFVLDGHGHDSVSVDANVNGNRNQFSDQEQDEERARRRFYRFT